MAEWMVWVALAAMLVILEMFSGTFYLLVLGCGLAVGSLAALAGLALPWQFLAAAMVGALGTFALRRSRSGRNRRIDPARDPNVNLDIGQDIMVEQWQTVDGVSSARVKYRGAWWDVELAPGALAQPGLFIIREVRGSRLILSNHQP